MNKTLGFAVLALGLGAASGFACTFLPSFDKGWIYAAGMVFAVPAVTLGALWWRPGWWRVILALVIISAAWPLAHTLTIMSYDAVKWLLPTTGDTQRSELVDYRLMMQTGNAIGSLATMASMALLARVWPSLTMLGTAVVCGGIIAAASVFARVGVSSADVSPEVLFPLWQAAMLGIAAVGLAWRRASEHDPRKPG